METKNWWDGITEENIQILKDNKTPLGLMPEPSRGVFDSIERSLIQYYCNGAWRQMTDYIPFSLCYAYRLNPNWQKPEPKKTDLEKEADRVLFKIIVDEMTRDDDDNIKPCPHCGKPPNEFSIPVYPGTAYQGSAPFQIRCGCTKADSMYGARVRWNQRKEKI